MESTTEEMAWYNSLPKEKQQLLDLWSEHDLIWTSGEVWEDKPHSVELEMYTDAGGDMIIDLEDISIKKLEEYVNNFDINEEVSVWWPDGEPGRGVPFDSMDEHVADLELWLAELRDIIDASRGKELKKGELSNRQQLAVDNFLAAANEQDLMCITFTWSKKKGFTFKSGNEKNKL